MIGSNSGDTLIGGAGDNVLSGGVGADVIDGGSGFNTADYSASSEAVGVDLAAGAGSGGDAAGDTLSHIQKLVGSAFDDTFAGDAADNTFRGGAGNDALAGASGSDSHLFGFGDGSDTITENGSAADTDRIVLDAGIAPTDVSVERDGNDLVLMFENQGQFLTDSIRVRDHFIGTASGIEQVVFADGTVWDRAALELRSHEGMLQARDDIDYDGVEEVTKVIDPAALFVNDVTGSSAGLRLVSVQNAVNGTVAITGDGQIAFTGMPLYHGDAYFTYTVADAFGRQSTARVKVMLASVDQAPSAINHAGLVAQENTVLGIPISTLLQGASDPESDPLTVIDGAPLLDDSGNPIAPVGGGSDHFGGSNLIGRIVHDSVIGDYVAITPAQDYYGFAGFRYEISDGRGGTAWADVQIYVNHVNQVPHLDEVTRRVRLGQTTVFHVAGLVGAASDPEGDPIHFAGIHDVVGAGVVYDEGAGTIAVTPTQLGLGSGTFRFDIADSYNATSTVNFILNVIPQYDPPVANDDGGIVTLENQAILIDPASLLANDSDPNGGTLTLQGLDRFAENGRVSITADGKILFAPQDQLQWHGRLPLHHCQ